MTTRKPTAEDEPPRDTGARRDDVVFVDAIEGERARLMWGVEAFDVPLRLLPAGTREGAWLKLSFVPAPAPPDEADAIRKKLSGGDDGGDIKL